MTPITEPNYSGKFPEYLLLLPCFHSNSPTKQAFYLPVAIFNFSSLICATLRVFPFRKISAHFQNRRFWMKTALSGSTMATTISASVIRWAVLATRSGDSCQSTKQLFIRNHIPHRQHAARNTSRIKRIKGVNPQKKLIKIKSSRHPEPW